MNKIALRLGLIASLTVGVSFADSVNIGGYNNEITVGKSGTIKLDQLANKTMFDLTCKLVNHHKATSISVTSKKGNLGNLEGLENVKYTGKNFTADLPEDVSILKIHNVHPENVIGVPGTLWGWKVEADADELQFSINDNRSKTNDSIGFTIENCVADISDDQANKSKPVQPVVQPDQPVVQPDQPVVQPDQPVVQPDQPVVQPDQPVVQPIVQPDQPVVQPDQPVVQPDQSGAQP